MLNPNTSTFEIKERYATQSAPVTRNPVEYQTENGFAIIRLGDVDKSVSTVGPRHYFIVRDPCGYELDITVEISNGAVAGVMWRCRGRITLESPFWITCAESHLATYLWENEDYPPDGKLTVDQLSLDDIDLARRWNCDEEKD
jgi:hypothetical protein